MAYSEMPPPIQFKAPPPVSRSKSSRPSQLRVELSEINKKLSWLIAIAILILVQPIVTWLWHMAWIYLALGFLANTTQPKSQIGLEIERDRAETAALNEDFKSHPEWGEPMRKLKADLEARSAGNR